jgi:tetratricopeptide (TPR) repeat protein/tRNA A-37 threonylcarbamoyl transferase component Bud32
VEAARWVQIQEVFHSASELPPDARSSYLDEVCAGDTELRNEVEGVLRSYRQTVSDPIKEAVDAGTGSLGEVSGGPKPGTQVGVYRLIRQIGEGGMGTVYLAERADQQYRRQVAIKLVRAEIAAGEVLERFRAERQILANLDHPNIARMMDGGISEFGWPYLVMEYVEGTPIDAYCRCHSLSIRDCVRLFRTVCSAVEHAHRNLTIHRDLKPSNILVTGEGVPKLLDFGIAKLLNEEQANGMTRATERLMTAEYASPEQILGEPVTTGTDVYGLGLILYELLTSTRAREVRDHSLLTLQRTICETDPRRPSVRAADAGRAQELRGDLDHIVLKALRREPEARYGSVEQLSGDLQNYLEGFPVVARRGSGRYRAAKFVRRQRVAVAVASALVLLISALAASMTVLAVRLARESARAEQVSSFLTQLFRGSDPFRVKGDKVTARELLDEGARRVARDLQGQPEVRAQVLDTMALAYQHLGAYDRAEALFQQEAAAYAEASGPKSFGVARSLREMADVQRQRSNFPAAELNLRRALAIESGVLAPTDMELSHVYNNLGLVLQSQGKLAEAKGLFEKAVAISRGYPNQWTETLVMMSNLGAVLAEAGDVARAGPLLREVLQQRRQRLGDDHPQTIRSMVRLSRVLRSRGDYTEAVQLLRASLAAYQRILGTEHPDSAASMDSLGEVLQEMGQRAEAEGLYRQAIAIGARTLGDHSDVALWQSDLASLLRQQGNYHQSERLYRQSLALCRKTCEDRSPRQAHILAGLGGALAELHDFTGAGEFLGQALAIERERLGADHPDTAAVLAELAGLREKQNQHGEAEALWRQALEIDRGAFPAGHLQTSSHLLGFSRLLLANRRPGDAAAPAREALELRHRLLPEGARPILEAAANLQAILAAEGQRPSHGA